MRSMPQGRKKRKRRVSKAQTLSRRRQADRARRSRRRNRTERRQAEQRQYRFKEKVVRRYSKLRAVYPEKQAVGITLAEFEPREDWHYALSQSSIRAWYRTAQEEGYNALRPQSKRPKTIQVQVPDLVVGIIFTLRRLYGWGGHRIAAELKTRGISPVSGKTVYKVFERLGLPVKVYALKGRSDGIAYRRYEKRRPNAQWHIDLKQTQLADGSSVYICILIDDYSRCALAAVAGTAKTTAWVTQVASAAIARCGQPDELVSDNGREFVSVWEDSLTQFGQLLAAQGVEHLTCAPYYPQGNGKAEAFIKILSRELLTKYPFDSLADLQSALDRYLVYYNNYRLHSALGWQPPISRYSGRRVTLRGLAGIPGIELMAAAPDWGDSACDPPIDITPTTAQRSTALVIWTDPAVSLAL